MFKLYQFDACPFCHKVIDKIKELNLTEGKDFELVEAAPGTPGREEVIKLGGKSQVPFLVDEDTKMYESADICNYLQEKYT